MSGNFTNTTGSYNIGIGWLSNTNSEGSNTTGSNNIGIGAAAGASWVTSGSDNISIGRNANENLYLDGARNIAIGTYANRQWSNGYVLSGTQGSRNIIIGDSINLPVGNSSNQLNIGNMIYGNGLNGYEETVSTGNIGIGVKIPAQKLEVAGNIKFTGLAFENTDTLATKAYARSLGGGITSYGKNATLDSTILLLSNGTRFAARDSVGTNTNFATSDLTATDNRSHFFNYKNLSISGINNLDLESRDISGTNSVSLTTDFANKQVYLRSSTPTIDNYVTVAPNGISMNQGANNTFYLTNGGVQLGNVTGIQINDTIGTFGQVLTSQGVGLPVRWTNASGGGVTITSYGKNAGRDSTILLLSDGTRFAARDSIGGGSSGGSSVAYYLNGSVSQGTIGGSVYYEMNKTPIIGGGTDFSIAGNGLISQFITDVADPNRLEIPAGNWNFEMYFSASSTGGTPEFYVELLKYNGTTFTSIASSAAVPEAITGGTIIDLYVTALAIPQTTLLATDRLAIRVYIVNSTGGRTITMHTEDSHLSEIITNFAGGVSALNGLTANTQYFATGTSGTDFAISSSSDTHTFNLPTASATNRGALSSADWSTFNGKTTVTSYGKNAGGDSTILLLSDGTRFAARDSIGSGGGSGIPLTGTIDAAPLTGRIRTTNDIGVWKQWGANDSYANKILTTGVIDGFNNVPSNGAATADYMSAVHVGEVKTLAGDEVAYSRLKSTATDFDGTDTTAMIYTEAKTRGGVTSKVVVNAGQGLVGAADYSGSYTDNHFVQKKWAAAKVNSFITLTDAATTNWDYATGINAGWTIGGNRTLAITNDVDGDVGVLVIIQDVTGGRTVTFPVGDDISGLSLVTTPSSVTTYSYIKKGSVRYWKGGAAVVNSLSVSSNATNADYTAVVNTVKKLPNGVLTANRTITIPAGVNGQLLDIYNRETAFTWTLAGSPVYYSDETTVVTTLTANTYYSIIYIDGKWTIKN
jgi:hypothetical protein